MAIGARKRPLQYNDDAAGEYGSDFWRYGHATQYNDDGAGPSTLPPNSRPNQILPVADLPLNFNGVPVDGAQYLAVVRREAKRAPMVARVANPYAAAVANASSAATKTPGQLPDTDWRDTFLTRFRNMRETLSNRPRPDGGAGLGVPTTKSPGKWIAFVRGEDGVPSDTKGKGREPSSALLAHFETQQIVHLLKVLAEAMQYPEAEQGADENNEEGLPAENTSQEQSIDAQQASRATTNETAAAPGALDPLYARWLFALLAHLDGRLVGDDVSNLRTLARACISVVARQRRAASQADIGAELGAWIVVCAIAGIWSQHDLWDDAAATLAEPTSSS